jgi:hypothetical protein
MQWYYGPEGDQRIWYESDEIEAIAEDELRRAGLMPSPDDPVTDLERLIEGHLKAQLDQYAQLPEGVLGVTQFDVRRHQQRTDRSSGRRTATPRTGRQVARDTCP